MITAESWSTTAGLEASVEATIEAGIPLIASAEITASIKLSVSGTYKRSNTHSSSTFLSKCLLANARKPLQPSMRGSSTPDIATGTILYTLDSGKKNSITEYQGPIMVSLHLKLLSLW